MEGKSKEKGNGKVDGKIKKLEEQRAKINAEIQRIKARTAKEERKKETRRLILMGALVKKMLQDGEFEEERLRRRMETFLTRDYDRELFDL